MKLISDALNVIAECTKSFKDAFKSAESFRLYLAAYGWELDPNFDDSGFSNVHEAFATEIEFLNQMDGDDAHKALAVTRLTTTLASTHSIDSNWPTPLNSTKFWTEFSQQIIDSVIWQLIHNSSPLIFALLRFGAVLNELEQIDVRATGTDLARLGYHRKNIDWDQLSSFISNPGEAFNKAYKWNSSANFRARELLNAIGAMFDKLPVATVLMESAEPLIDKYYNKSTSSDKIELLSIMPYLLSDSSGSIQDLLKISINFLPIPEDESNTGPPCGIVIFPIISGNLQTILSLAEGINLIVEGAYSSSPINAEIRPDSVRIELPGITDTSISASIKVEAANETSPWVIIGSSDGPRFEVSKAHVGFNVKGSIQNPVFEVGTGLDKASIIIDFTSSDGFLKNIFGDKSQQIDTEIAINWSSQNGLRISGGATLDMDIPAHVTLFDTITIDSVKIKLSNESSDSYTNFKAGVVASLKLGPIRASVDNMGIKFGVKPTTDGSGNIGIFDLSLGFLPPKGIGFALDTDFISGGGFLEIDDVNKRYAGILELKAGEIGITAIGLIATRMPDGSDGFSLLISIGVTFRPAIQLSFGFVLSGVGGLMGLNRTMITDVLRDGLKNRTLNSILFPEDPIANASKIISDLRSVFPPEEERFIIGPMVKIGWGSPTIITADIGIFIELPSPIRIVLMGEIALTLPTPDNIIVEMHIDVLGVIDFGKKELSIDASIYDSRIYQLVLSGDAALRWSWGDNPYFAVSLGGFHPRFAPPPSIGALARLSLNISHSSSLQISCWVYNALTSNSLQFGAGVEFYAKAGGASVEGGMSFDALIYFNPFSFSIDMSGHLVARYKGHRLAGVYVVVCLSGPAPWNARGTATFSILLWDISINFDKTWGKSDNDRLPSVDPWLGVAADGIMGLKEALEMNGSWGSRLPDQTHMFESIKEIDNSGTSTSGSSAMDKILVHPCGRLEIKQKILPFGIHLEKLGNNPVHGHNDFTLRMEVDVGGIQQDLSVVPLMEDFARGQYKNLDKSQRLSLPSFEKMQSGVLAGDDTVSFIDGKSVHKELVYESILINPDLTSQAPLNRTLAAADWCRSKYHIRANAAKICRAYSAGKGKYSTYGKSSKISIVQDGYTVVNQDDLSPVAFAAGWPENNGSLNRTKADEMMQMYINDNPGEELQVVSTFELEEVT